MRRLVVAAMLVGSVTTVTAQTAQEVPQITVRPLDDRGGQGYVGPYGRSLPGVSMFAGRAVPATPLFANGGVPLPTLQKRASEYTYQDPLPILDGYHGTLGRGFAF